MAMNEPQHDQRTAPRASDHLDHFRVNLVHGKRSIGAVLTDESVTGVGVRLDEHAPIETDSLVIVRHGANTREAIVQRVWRDQDGATHLGLLWRAALQG